MKKEIRVKPVKGKPKILERLVSVPREILRKSSETAKSESELKLDSAQDTPRRFAEDKAEQAIKQTACTIKDGGQYAIKQIKSKIKDRIDNARTIITNNDNTSGKQKSKPISSARNEPKNTTHPLEKSSTQKIDSPKKTILPDNINYKNGRKTQSSQSIISNNTTEFAKKGTVKTRKVTRKTIKSSAKSVKKTAKAAVKTSKSAVKTAKQAVKETIKATKDTAKAAQAAARAARLAAKAAKTAIKILQAIIKALIKAVQALIQLIAAGGWVVLLVILIVVVVVVLIVFLLGIFFAEDSGGLSVKETIAETNAAFELAIETQVNNLSVGEYDKVNIIYNGNMDGDSNSVNNWRDILIVFAAKRMGSGETSIELTEESKAELIHLFYSMNDVSYRTEIITQTISEKEENYELDTETDEAEDADSETVDTITVLNIFVMIKSKTWEEEAEILMFDVSQMQFAEELAKPEYYFLFADLIGNSLYDKENIGDLKDVISRLPKEKSGSAAVELVLSRIGDPYSQPDRGRGNYVDCSYLVWWAYNQVGINLPGTSVEQAQYCIENGWSVGQSELQPGDLVFWSKTTCGCGRWNEIHHVGMYIGNNKVVEASSSKGCVVVSELWGLSGGKWQVYAYARPS